MGSVEGQSDCVTADIAQDQDGLERLDVGNLCPTRRDGNSAEAVANVRIIVAEFEAIASPSSR